MRLPGALHRAAGARDRDVARRSCWSARSRCSGCRTASSPTSIRRSSRSRPCYPGAAPEVVETSVTQPLEDQLIGIEGIKHVTSLSREQVSPITRRVRARPRRRRRRQRRARPRRARAQRPARGGRGAGRRQARRRRVPDHVDRAVRRRARRRSRSRPWPRRASRTGSRKLPGVAEVWLAGERATRCASGSTTRGSPAHGADRSPTSPRRCSARTSTSRRAASRAATASSPCARSGELKTAEEYGALIVAEIDGGPVRLRDVGRVEVGPEDERKLVRFNGEPAVGARHRQAVEGQHARRRATRSSAELEAIGRRAAARRARSTSAFDSSIFIERSIERRHAHDRRGDRPGRDRDLPLPAHAARDAHARRSRSRSRSIGTFAVLVLPRLLDQHAHADGRSRSRSAWSSTTRSSCSRTSRAGSRRARRRMEAARRGMDEISFAVIAATVSTDRGLPAARLPDRHDRAAVPRVRRHRRGRGRHLGLRRAHALADARARASCAAHASRARRQGAARARLRRGSRAATRRRCGRSLARTAASSSLVGVALGRARRRAARASIAARVHARPPIAASCSSFTRAPEGSTIDYTDRYQRQVEKIVLGDPGGRRRSFSVVSLGIGTPGLVNEGAIFAIAQALGGARPHAAGDRRRAARPLRQLAGIQAFPINPPRSARACAPRRSRWSSRDPTSSSSRATPTRSCAARGRSRASSTCRPTCCSTSRSSRSRSTATAPATSACRCATSPRRCRSCSAALDALDASSSAARPTT